MKTTIAQSPHHGTAEPGYRELFEPIRIGKCEIKNRIAMAPMNVLFSMNNRGYPNEQIMAYYAARAKGGMGLIITECVLGTRLAAATFRGPPSVTRPAAGTRARA